MLYIENDRLVSYDGLKSSWETISLRSKDIKFVKTVQGDVYGVCAEFYYNECMKRNNNINMQKSVAAMHDDDRQRRHK